MKDGGLLTCQEAVAIVASTTQAEMPAELTARLRTFLITRLSRSLATGLSPS